MIRNINEKCLPREMILFFYLTGALQSDGGQALSRNRSADFTDFTDYKQISYVQVILIQN